MKEWQEYVKEDFMPIYRENPGESLDVDDFAWWAQMGSDLASSMTAFVGTGFATGGVVGLGAKAVSRGARAIKFLQTAKTSAQLNDRAVTAINGGQGLANMVMLNRAEGVAEATGVYDEQYRAGLEEGLSEIKAKERAAGAAAATVHANMANLPLQLTSASAFIHPVARATRGAARKSFGRQTRERIGYESAQESAEETINLGAQQVGTNVGESSDSIFDGILDRIGSWEGIEAAMLGAIGGAGQTGLTSLGNSTGKNPFTGMKDEKGNRVSVAKMHNKAFQQRKQEIERVNRIMQSRDVPSLTSIYKGAKDNVELQRQLNEAVEKGDDQKAQEIQRSMFSHQVFTALSEGNLDEQERVYQNIRDLSPEKADRMGPDMLQKITNPYQQVIISVMN